MPNYPVKGKYHLAKRAEELLFKGPVKIFEKVDGANCGIVKSNNQVSLQKKGDLIDDSHPQFSFFQNQWFWDNKDKIYKLPDEIVVYGELLRCVHTIYYDRLPDWFLVFDIFDLKQNRYLDWDEVINICKKVGLSTVPLISMGKIKKDDLVIPVKSRFGDMAEGIVVKNYATQVRCKLVKPEFVKTIDESGYWRNKKIKLHRVI